MTTWPTRLAAWGMSGAALLGGLVPTARAQTPDVQLAPSRVVECMTPPAAQRGEPEYPFALWKRGEGGSVLVELVFTGTDRAPRVEVIHSQGDDTLVDAVKAHVATFRTPCADAADLPVRLRQDYVFLPDKRKAVWTTPADLADPARQRVLKCMAANDGSETPEYPEWALRAQAQGSLLAKLRFTAPDRPPEVTVHAASRTMKQMAQTAVLPWVAKLRLPCIEGAAVESITAFKFTLEGKPAYGFKNLGFLQFLRGAKNLEQPGAVFDTNAMGCPFDVRLQYLQPHFPNRMGQLGEPAPRRQALLDWMSTLVLDLRDAQLDAVTGDMVTLTVPCIKIDLTPKEKTS